MDISGMAKVPISEVDLSMRVPSFPGVYVGILIPGAKKGDTTKPVLCTNEDQFLKRYTPNGKIEVGYDSSYWSALAVLQRTNKLWVRRVVSNATYGGLIIHKRQITNSEDPLELVDGVLDPQAVAFASETIGPEDVSVTENTISVNQEYVTGEKITFALVSSGTGDALPAPLVSGTVYYAIRIDADTIKVASSLTNARSRTAIDITAAGKGTFTISPSSDKLLYIYGSSQGSWVNGDLSINIINYVSQETVSQATAVDATGDKIQVTQNIPTGYPIKLSSSGTMPEGLTAGTQYYAVNANTSEKCYIKIAETVAKALAGTTIDITSTGSGSLTIIPSPAYVKDPINNEDNEATSFLIQVYWKGTLVEEWVTSRERLKDAYGRNVYIEDYLEGSEYIRVVNNSLVEGVPNDVLFGVDLGGGDDGDPITDSQYGALISALDDFKSSDAFPMTLILDGGWSLPAYQQALYALCEQRMDCVAILSVPYEKEASADYLNNIINYRKIDLNANTSYAALYTPHVKIYDRFNDRSLYVPPDGYVGAVISYTGANYELWYPSAGFRRGVIKVLDVRRRFTDGEMDLLYDAGINPIRFAVGRGILVWGQKTLYSIPSALDRLNVRLLLIVIEPAIKAALENFLFELNDKSTRSLMITMISSYLAGIKSRRGLYDYLIQDKTTDEDIDAHIARLAIFVKPTLSVEYIPTQVVITRTGVDFSLVKSAV